MAKAKAKVKAGTSKRAAADKKVLFVEAYLSNGGNATQAALEAGYSQGGASKQGYRMSKDPEIVSMLDIRRKSLLETMDRHRIERAVDIELNTERLIREVARIAFSDARNIYHPDGKMKRLDELDDVTAAAVASYEVSPDGTIKYKFWDKNSAQERAAKIIGAFEKDNHQKTDPLADLLGKLSGKVLGVSQ